MELEEILDLVDENDEINDKWLIPESKLDDIQYKILYDCNSDLTITGCAGSGKTILGIYKLVRIIKENLGSYAFIVFTLTLEKFIKTGIQELEGDSLSCEELKNLKVYHSHEILKIIDQGKFEKVDYIIIDEAQDLGENFYETIKKYVKKSIIILGDDEQQIYEFKKEEISMYNISKVLGIKDIENIKYNYRVPKPIAKFAGKIINDNGELEKKCKKTVGDDPIIKKFDNFEKELEFISEFIDEEKITDAAILVFKNKEVEKIKDFFNRRNKKIQCKYYYGDNECFNNIDFSSEIPKSMTYHSSKGLEFDYVFLPNLKRGNLPKDFNKNTLFVACTRAKKKLIITYSGKLSEYIK